MDKKMNEKGVILITSFMVISVLIILGTATISRSISEKNVAQNYTESVQALAVAEAGVQRAVYEFNYGDGNWSSWTDDDGDKTITTSLGSMGSYQVTVTDPTAATPTIIARGHVPDEVVSRIKRDIDAEVGIQTVAPFNYAGFGKSSITFGGGSSTDSYNSDEGDGLYHPGGENGDVGTNGDAVVENGDNVEINGDTVTNANQILNSIAVPTALTSLDSTEDISLNPGVTGSIDKDKKFDQNSNFSGSINVQPNATLTIINDVSIYLTENSKTAFDISGNLTIATGASLTVYTDGKVAINADGLLNVDGKPSNLIIYSTYSGNGGVTITGGSDFYGAVYAPDTDISLSGGASVYGSLVGDSVDVSGGGNIHHDEALDQISESTTTYEVQLWEDAQTPYSL